MALQRPATSAIHIASVAVSPTATTDAGAAHPATVIRSENQYRTKTERVHVLLLSGTWSWSAGITLEMVNALAAPKSKIPKCRTCVAPHVLGRKGALLPGELQSEAVKLVRKDHDAVLFVCDRATKIDSIVFLTGQVGEESGPSLQDIISFC
jgi:hypothetical protein